MPEPRTALTLPAAIPGPTAMNGTRMPPSLTLPLAPLNGGFGRFRPPPAPLPPPCAPWSAL